MAIQRLREDTGGGKFTIHVNDAFGDGRTLCGYAYEGSCVKSEGDHGVTVVFTGPITCQSCLRIIRHCKTITPRVMGHR